MYSILVILAMRGASCRCAYKTLSANLVTSYLQLIQSFYFYILLITVTDNKVDDAYEWRKASNYIYID